MGTNKATEFIVNRLNSTDIVDEAVQVARDRGRYNSARVVEGLQDLFLDCAIEDQSDLLNDDSGPIRLYLEKLVRSAYVDWTFISDLFMDDAYNLFDKDFDMQVEAAESRYF